MQRQHVRHSSTGLSAEYTVLTRSVLCRALSLQSEEYSSAFGESGAIPGLVGLLDSPAKQLTLSAARAIAVLAASASNRMLIR